jgi:hypothetical protein
MMDAGAAAAFRILHELGEVTRNGLETVTIRVSALAAMISLEECKSHSAECLRLAESAPSREQKTILLDLAREWDLLARRLQVEAADVNEETRKSA